MIYSVTRLTAIILCKFLFNLKVFGINNLPKNRGFIIASNHSSFLDPIVIAAAVPKKINFIARDTLFSKPLFGWYLKHLRVMPIKRNYGDFGAIRQAVKFLKKGQIFTLFPQGTRDGEDIKSVKAGAALLAESADVPIVPVRITGASRAWGKNDKFIKPTRISVSFGEPIFVNNMNREAIMNLVIECINKLE